jgi:hypothetical protein
MKLVETDADRPEDETEPAPAVTPPVPEKRRAYASLIFTAAILIGTVVGIYSVFPARKDEATRQVVSQHRRSDVAWQLAAPSRAELEAWTLALAGDGAPLPPEHAEMTIVGARPIEIHHRDAAFMRFRVGSDEVSYLVAPTSDAPEGRASRRTGDDHIEAWRSGKYTCIAVGPAASADAWKLWIGVP